MRRWAWVYAIAFALVVLFAALPLLSALAAGAVASMTGCQLDEGSVHPCLISGYDAGEALYTFMVLGWLGLATIPFGMTLLGVLAVIVALHLLGWLFVRWRSAASR